MSYSQVFGGQNVFPSQLTYLSITSGGNVSLQWPTEQALPGASVFADIIECTLATTLTMPDARRAAPGQSCLVNNRSVGDINVLDNAGNTIGTVPSGEVWQFYLSSNATQAGTWRTFEFGTGVSSATAAALAGAGLVAVATALNTTIIPRTTNTTPYALVDGDRGTALVWTGGVGAWTIPNQSIAFASPNGWYVYVTNRGTGNLTITPTVGAIDGEASLVLSPGEDRLLFFTSAQCYTFSGGSSGGSATFDYTTIGVAGSGDYTLAGNELNRISYEFTGVLSGARNVVVPNTVQQYWIKNATSGAFDLTVKTAAGTGIVVPQGSSLIVFCDGVNVIAADGASSTGVRAVLAGGTGATTAANARTNLGVAFSGCTVGKTADQTCLDNAATTITWDFEALDVGGWHDNAVNNSRLTVPAGITVARFVADIELDLGAVGGDPFISLFARIFENGAGSSVKQYNFAFALSIPATGTKRHHFTLDTGWMTVTPGDYFELELTINQTGVGGSVRGSSAILSTFSAEGRVN